MKVSHWIGLKVASRAGLLKEYRERVRDSWVATENISYRKFLSHHDQGFWKWVKDNVDVAIAPVEGVKKAGALLSKGVAALSVVGIWNGSPKNEEGIPELHPQLKYFAQPGREAVIVFDQDGKIKTQASVTAARERLRDCFRQACCKVTCLAWETEEKGIDDAIAANGSQWFDEMWKKRGSKPKTVKLSRIEHDLPAWNEKSITDWLATLYEKKLIYEDRTKEWYLYGGQKEGVWSITSNESIERMLMTQMDNLLDESKKFNKQIYTAMKSVKESNRDKFEKKELLSQLKEQLIDYRSYKLRFVKDCRERLSRVVLIDKFVSKSDPNLIPMANGVLDLQDRILHPHSPKNHYTSALPYEYAPNTPYQPIKEWLIEMLEGDLSLVEVVRAYLHGVVTGRCDWQKYLELIGPGGTGKSTLIRLAIALVGFENVHNTTFKKLEKSNFETASIKDKRLVVITDAERYTGDVSTLKALTGQDTLPYEKKRQQATGGFKPTCMVILAANENIKTSDYTSGLERRRVTVKMKNKISGIKQKDLINISDEGLITGEFASYLPGLLNWVLGLDGDKARHLINNVNNRSIKMTLERVETLIENNPIAAWLNANIVYDPSAQTHVGLAVKSADIEEGYLRANELLYPNYCAYCDASNLKPVNMQRFSALLLDFCQNQLNLSDVFKDENRNGRYIQGLRIREVNDLDPRFIEFVALQRTKDSDHQVASSSTSGDLVFSTIFMGEGFGVYGDYYCNNQSKNYTSIPIPVMEGLVFQVVGNEDEKITKESPTPSTPSPTKVVEVTNAKTSIQPETKTSEKKKVVIHWDDLMAGIEREIKRIGWTIKDAQEYILAKYQKHSRELMSDAQLLELFNYLKGYQVNPQQI